MSGDSAALPDFASALEAVYGQPSHNAFGSAVFYVPDAGSSDLESLALEKYKYFTGDLWERYGEEVWLGPWRNVYARPAGAAADIVAELRAIDDAETAVAVPMILDNVDDADQGRAALAGAFDDPTVNEVAVFNLGDGEAMSGLLLAGRRQATGDAIFLVFLLD